MHGGTTQSERDEAPSILVFLPLSEPPEAAQPNLDAPGAASPARHTPHPVQSPTSASAAIETSATAAEPEPEAISPPPPDWRQEARIAASHQIDTGERERDTPSLLAPHQYPQVPSQAPQFGWNYAATHRLEGLKEGGLLFHINDHCVILIVPMLFPACKIGKIAGRGDLFQHMDDAPVPGDSKDH
jgi:hypothetical protein